MNENLFYKSKQEAKKTLLTNFNRITYAIDSSGSTGGQILNDERESAKIFFSLLSPRQNYQILEWNSCAKQLSSLDDLKHSSGGTSPSCISSSLEKYQPELLVLYTDGECDRVECNLLSQRLTDMNLSIPIIIVFTLKRSLCVGTTTVKSLEQQINMSVPESVMKASSDVCIVLNVGGTHRLFMASGAFRQVYSPISLEEQTRIGQLTPFDFLNLAQVSVVESSSIPQGCLRIAGYEDPVILEAIYAASSVPTPLITAISDRIILPKLDLNRVHQLCVRLLSAGDYENDAEYKQAMENLMRVAVASQKSDEHKACRQKVDEIKRKLKGVDTPELRAQRAAVQNLLQVIADYRANQNQFVLGSNRANRATVLSLTDPNQLRESLTSPAGNTLTIQDCPIFMEPGNACILLTSSLFKSFDLPKETASSSSKLAPPPAPPKSNTEVEAELVSRATNDFNINSPFHMGVTLFRPTRHIFSAQAGLDFAENPFTREPVCARIVLTKDIHSLMRQLCRAFCGSRQMWHVVMAFASMLAKHLLEDEWAEHAILLPYFTWLTNEIRTTPDFSDDSLLSQEQAMAKRVPLVKAIENTMNDYSVIMRNRLPSDSRAMMNIPLALATLNGEQKTVDELQRKIIKIGGLLNVVETFARLLDAYKKNANPLDFIMERDPIYEQCVAPRKGISAIIGMVLFLDALQCSPNSRRGPKRYLNLALQDAVDLALREAKASADPNVSALCRAFSGENVDDVVPLCIPTVPQNLHFGDEHFQRTAIIDGQHFAVCGYCGFKRAWSGIWRSGRAADQQAHSDMREHFLRSFTPQFFYNGYRYVQEAFSELGVGAPEEKIFIETKNKLYAKHGVNFWALHTQDCKNQLLYFIRMRKYEAGILAEKPIKEN